MSQEANRNCSETFFGKIQTRAHKRGLKPQIFRKKSGGDPSWKIGPFRGKLGPFQGRYRGLFGADRPLARGRAEIAPKGLEEDGLNKTFTGSKVIVIFEVLLTFKLLFRYSPPDKHYPINSKNEFRVTPGKGNL